MLTKLCPRRDTAESIETQPTRCFILPLAAAAGAAALANGGLLLFSQLYLKHLNAPPILIGLVASLNAGGVLLGSLVWGTIADRAPRKHLLLGTLTILTLTLATLITLPSASIVLASTLVRNFAFIGFVTTAMAAVSSASQSSDRGRNLSTLGSAQAIGFTVSSVAAGYLLDRLGFRSGFVVLTFLPLIGIGILMLGMKGGVQPQKRTLARGRGLARQRGLTSLYIGTALRQLGVVGSFGLVYVYMASLGLTPGSMGILVAVNPGIQIIALPWFGRAADRVGRRRVFLFGFGASVAIPCILACAPSVAGIACALVLLSVAFSALQAGTTAHIGDAAPANRQGTVLGLFEASRGTGGFLGPLLAGMLVPWIGYRGMFITMAALTGIGFLFVLCQRTPSRKG